MIGRQPHERLAEVVAKLFDFADPVARPTDR
jgi:hypothetical protein